jgi:hypothetical protein
MDIGYTDRTFNNRSYAPTRDDGFGQGDRSYIFPYGQTSRQMNIAELLKKNFVLVPIIASVVVGTFSGVKYIVSLTETINKNKDEINIIKNTNLKNQITYISQLTMNQNKIKLEIEREKGSKELLTNKFTTIFEKIKEIEFDIKQILLKGSR